MSPQHDYQIDNSTGANVRADINGALSAIATNNSGSSAPSTTFASQFFADTSAGQLKLRNTSNNGYVSLFTLAGGVNVDAASNFNEDVTFKGATSGRNIVFDRSDNALEFLDNAKATFGTDADLQISQDGSEALVRNTTGDFFIQNSAGDIALAAEDNITLKNFDGQTYARFMEDAQCELYFDNIEKLRTNVDGVTFLEHAFFGDNNRAKFGTGNDLQIFHDGSDSFIDSTKAGGQLLIRTKESGGTTNNAAKFLPDGTVELYHDGTKRFQTTGSGVTVTGTVTETSDIALKSNIQPLTNTLEKIQQITGYKYNLVNSISPSMGVIAQDVEKVFPELVHGSEGKKTLQYSGLIGVLVEAVKDLSAKVATLEAS